jgi:hypothetical protein
MVMVSLVEWCNNSVNNRDLHAIHHGDDLLDPYQIDLEHDEQD